MRELYNYYKHYKALGYNTLIAYQKAKEEQAEWKEIYEMMGWDKLELD